MALTLRRRGETWHARGTVRVGQETITVREFSTGCRARSDAEAVRASEEARIRRELLEGPAGRARSLTVADCILAYADRPKGVSQLDAAKLAALNELLGGYRLDALHEAWDVWRAAHRRHAPGTLVRTRALLLAAVRHGCEAKKGQPPTLPTVEVERDQRVAMLTEGERRRLLAAYSPHAACPALLLADQGMRTQEVLRLDWRDVTFATETLRAGVRRGGAKTKTRRGRPVPMTQRVFMLLWGMWHAAGQPEAGPVFLSSRGKPYEDTSDKGGNPLRSAHATACKAAGIRDFRVHDLRHDWAARMVMAGVDLFTLMKIGGWSSLAMVERYAGVSATHLRDAIRKIEPLPNPCPTQVPDSGRKRAQAFRVVPEARGEKVRKNRQVA